jgi:RNA polymerase sigma-70 factor, ECF subfamily
MKRISAGNGLSMEASERVLDMESPEREAEDSVDPKQLAAQIFDELRLPVSRYLVCLGVCPAVAGEIVQEAFLRLYRHLRADGRRENLAGWVFRVAHNLAVNEMKRAVASGAELADARVDPGGDPEQILLRKERMRKMEAAIGSLPMRQQQCLHLRAEGLRYREIAEVVGIGVSSVAEAVQRAIETLTRACHE